MMETKAPHKSEEHDVLESMKNAIKYRWKLIKSYIGWEDYLGFMILFVGILGFINSPFPFIPGWTDFYHEIRAELIGI
jgi:hypothetical protein